MPRRVLLCTIGTTPQVVTETVWALSKRSPSWSPDDIIVVTTTQALGRVRAALQAPDGPLAALLGRRPPTQICVPCADGRILRYRNVSSEGEASNREGSAEPAGPPVPLHDVNTPEDTTLMGDAIHRLVVEVVRDPESQLHLSLAGGRKTMSAHALLSFTLVGRDTDEASHVLISPPYETLRDFWHPGQSGPLRLQDGSPVDPAAAEIELVPLTTPLMRYRLKRAEELEDLDLRALVRQVNVLPHLQVNPSLIVDSSRNVVSVGDVECRLGLKLFALYRLIAVARAEGWAGVGPDGVGPEHSGWLTFEHICHGVASSGVPIEKLLLDYIADAFRAEDKDLDDGALDGERENAYTAWRYITGLQRTKAEAAAVNLNPNLVHLASALRRAFGPEAASYLAPSSKRAGGRFGIPTKLPSQAIEIR